jgi:hypothetical protein
MLAPPAELSARDVVPPPTAEDGSGLSIAKGTRNDLRLITVAGTVIQVAKGLLSQTLTLVSEDQTFSVTLPASGAWAKVLPDARAAGGRIISKGRWIIEGEEIQCFES